MSGNVVRKINDTLSTQNSLKRFLDQMNFASNIENYKKWYSEEFNTEFDENQFHENAYSKLIRDLHDGVISTNTNPVNKDIKDYSTKR